MERVSADSAACWTLPLLLLL